MGSQSKRMGSALTFLREGMTEIPASASVHDNAKLVRMRPANGRVELWSSTWLASSGATSPG